MRYYDARLLGYLTMLDIPLQKAVLNLYEQSPSTSNRAVAAALIYNSSQALSLLTAKFIFEQLHNVNKKTADQYYVLPTTEYTYKRHQDFTKTQPIEQQAILNKRAEAVLASAPRYSKGMIDLSVGLLTAKVAFGTLVGYQLYRNPLKGLLYGVFVPSAVIRKDLNDNKSTRGE